MAKQNLLTQNENIIFTIYMHENTTTHKKYIGQTSKENLDDRWRNGRGYSGSPNFKKAIQEEGWDNFNHIILEQCNNKEEANEKESYYIKKYDTLNPEKGYNIRPGGTTAPLAEETKIKIKEHSSHKPRTEEIKLKISLANSGEKNGMARKIECIETHKIFETMKDAADWANLKSISGISRVCKGERKTAGGYSWRYVEEIE